MRVTLRVLLLIGLGAALCVALYWGVMPAVWGAVLPAAPVVALPAPVQVVVVTARNEDVPITLSGIGTVQAYNSVAVKSRVDGEISQILFTEGQDVRPATRSPSSTRAHCRPDSRSSRRTGPRTRRCWTARCSTCTATRIS